MPRIKPLRAKLVLPLAVAIATLCSSITGFAQTGLAPAPADPTLIQSQLDYFTDNETAIGGALRLDTVATTSADNVVFALYNALQARLQAGTLTDTIAAQLAQQTLATTAGRIRSDRNTIVSRIITAAIQGSDAESNPARVKAILDAVGTVNANTRNALSAAGRSAAVAAALRNSTGAGAQIAQSAIALSAVGKERAFVIAALKGVLNRVDDVPAFIDKYLDLTVKNTDAEALAIAQGLITRPVAAGAVIAGRALDLTNGIPSAITDPAVKNLLSAVVTNARLAKEIAQSLGQALPYLSVLESRSALTTALVTSKKSQAAAIAAGVVHDVTEAEVAGIIQAAITAGAVRTTAYATFAGKAAEGNTTNADEIVTAVFNLTPVTAADKTNAQKIAIAVINTAAQTDPQTASEIGAATAALQRSTVDLYATDTDLNALAAALAKGVTKDYTATGAAVAGVGTQLAAITPASYSSLAASAISSNPRAAAGIALGVGGLLTGNTDIKAFAISLATTTRSTNVPLVAIGVSILNPLQAGDLTKSIISISTVLNRSAISIATKVANSVDIESISDVAGQVATLFQPKVGGVTTLPKISSLGAFATAMTRAINAKPVAAKATVISGKGQYEQFSWHNRVDEIGELAAVLVNASLNISGGSDPKAIAAIGTSIFKAVSQRLLANAGRNQVDIKDIAQDVAGAIFQSIAVAAANGTFTEQVRTALLDNSGATGSLLALLTKGYTKYGSLIAQALTEVKIAVAAGGNKIVGGTEVLTGGVLVGKYEIGSINDPETPAANL